MATQVTLAGTFERASGVAASGAIGFTLSAPLHDTDDDRIVPPTERRFTLDETGSFSATLDATNDPTTDPTGLTYIVREMIDGASERTYRIELDYQTASQRLEDIAPATDVTLHQYALSSALTAHNADTTSVHGISDTSKLAIGYLPRPGRWYGPFVGVAPAGGQMTANALRGGILVVERTTTFDRIRAEVTTAGGTGSVIRLGVYRELEDGTSELVLDAGTIDGTSQTIQSIEIDLELTPGIYILAAVEQGGPSPAATVRRIDNGGVYPWMGAGDTTMISNGTTTIGFAITGALPATGTSTVASAIAALVQLRVAAS